MPGQTIEEVVLKISMQVAETAIKAPNVQAATAAVKQVDQAVAQATQRMDKHFQEFHKEVEEANKALVKSIKEQGQAQQAAMRSQKEAEDQTKRMVETWGKASEGALRFGRGVALLAASLDDDLGKAIQKYVLPAQAAIDITVGLTKTYQALALAAKTSAAAQLLLNAAFGPVGLALAALGAGALAAKHHYDGLREAELKEAEAAKASAEAHRKEVEQLKAIEESAAKAANALIKLKAEQQSSQERQELRRIETFADPRRQLAELDKLIALSTEAPLQAAFRKAKVDDALAQGDTQRAEALLEARRKELEDREAYLTKKAQLETQLLEDAREQAQTRLDQVKAERERREREPFETPDLAKFPLAGKSTAELDQIQQEQANLTERLTSELKKTTDQINAALRLSIEQLLNTQRQLFELQNDVRPTAD